MNITETLTELKTKDLSPKHLDIVESFAKAHRKWGRLTSRQEGYLQVIVAEYSDENIKARAEYVKRFTEDEEYRNDVRIVSEYYLRSGYYRGTARSCLAWLDDPKSAILEHPNRVKKMMDNKYAQNVLASTKAPPKFAVGELVQLRAQPSWDNVKAVDTANYYPRNVLGYEAFMVIEVDSLPISRSLTYNKTRGGTRWYRLLPLGGTKTFDVCEREVKRPTKKVLGK